MTTIEIPQDVEALLEALKKENPALDNAEILQRALSQFYREQELERRRKWVENLPELELSDEERTELTAALEEADEAIRRGEAKTMTVEEIMTEARSG